MTLAEFVRAEWKPNAALALKKSSMRIYDFQLDRHIFPALGSMALRNIDRAQIEACLSNMKRKGHATSTLRNIRATFSTVLQSAVEPGFLAKNPRMASAFAKRIRKKSGGFIRLWRCGGCLRYCLSHAVQWSRSRF
jgi:Phage integrase, N-terminal SAM-like domain